MRIYEINDEESRYPVGILIYYERAKAFIVELEEYLDEWTAPLLFTKYVKEGIYTIPREDSLLWVKERVIPSSRQNIGSILSEHGLKAYDEMRFLELSKGKCSHDSLYIRKIDELPEYAAARASRNLKDCIPLDDYMLLCFFCDGSVKKVNLRHFAAMKGVDKVLHNDELYLSCLVGPGGYSATFNDSIDIPAALLYSYKDSIPFNTADFIAFVQRGLSDTSESCDILECSRQNLSYMTNHTHLTPVKKNVKGSLYLKGDVVSNRW